MQSRATKPSKAYPKHAELSVAPPDPNTSIAWMLQMIGERKKVLDVGCASGYFANLLLKQECDIVGIDINPAAAEEARRFCTSVIVADLDEATLPGLLGDRRFDVVAFGDVLEHLREPVRTLDESRNVLQEGGFVVASIPNITHGAIRLALLSGRFDYQELGILDDAHLRFFTAKTIDELFLTAGFRVETMERVSLPLFRPTDLVPVLDPRDFDEQIIADVRSDPDSETLQFIVKAFPLSDDQRFRAVSKRFLTANTELTAAKQQIDRRERELDRMRGAIDSKEASERDLRDRTAELGEELKAVQGEYRRLRDEHRLLEAKNMVAEAGSKAADDLRAANRALQDRLDTALERLFQAQSQPLGAIQSAEILQSQLGETERTRDEARAQAAALAAEVASLKSLLAEVPKHSASETQALTEEVSGQRQRVAALERERERLAADLETLRIELGVAGERTSEAQRLLDEECSRTVDLQRRLGDAQQSASDNEAAREQLASEVQALRDELLLVGQHRAEAQRLFDDEQARMVELQRMLDEAQRRASGESLALLEELSVERQRAVALEAEREALTGRLETVQTELFVTGQRAVDLERALTEAEQRSLELENKSKAAADDQWKLKETIGSLKIEMHKRASTDRRRTAELEQLLADAEHQRSISEIQWGEAAEVRVRLEAALARAESDQRLLTAELETLEVRLADEEQRNVWTEAARSHLAGQVRALQGVCRVEAERQQELQYELDCRHFEAAIYKRSFVETKQQLGNQLAVERDRAGQLERLVAELQSRIESLDDEVDAITVEFVESKRAFDEKESAFVTTIAKTERACEELLAEAGEAVRVMQAHLARERDLAEFQRHEAAAAASALEAEVEAIRKAAAADRAVMRAYADDFRQRAEKAESEFVTAIRQRDELYLNKLELERISRDVSQNCSRLEDELNRDRVNLEQERNATARLQAELTALAANHEALQTRLAESDQRLVTQTEQLVASAAAESARLATLIDTVQSSHFWKIKNWLSRLRSRGLGALR